MWLIGVGWLGFIPVRDELKLTDEQQAKIKEIGDEFTEKHARPASEAIEKLPAQEQRKKADELRELERDAMEKALGVLEPEQVARFRQIEIWLSGPSAFRIPDVERRLNLTEQQKGVLKTIDDEYGNALIALNKQPRERFRTGESSKFAEQMAELEQQRQELRQAKEAECLSVLTDDQKERFLKLRGEKFELRPNRARRAKLP
jgi:Spy/CpxP family protein refolding chaperone